MFYKDLHLDITPVKEEDEDEYEKYFKGMYLKNKRAFVEFAAVREYRKGLKRTWEEADEMYQEKLQKYL